MHKYIMELWNRLGWKGPRKNLAVNSHRDRAATTRHLLKSSKHEKEIHVQRMWDTFSAFL